MQSEHSDGHSIRLDFHRFESPSANFRAGIQMKDSFRVHQALLHLDYTFISYSTLHSVLSNGKFMQRAAGPTRANS